MAGAAGARPRVRAAAGRDGAAPPRPDRRADRALPQHAAAAARGDGARHAAPRHRAASVPAHAAPCRGRDQRRSRRGARLSCRTRASSMPCCGGSARKGRRWSPSRMRRGSTRRPGCGAAGARPMARAWPAPSRVAHLKEAPLDLTVRGDARAIWREALEAVLLPTGTLRRSAGGADHEPARLSPKARGGCRMPPPPCRRKLFGDVAGAAVVDLCAAPGGKTAQLAAAGARVTAIDRSPRRVERLNANLARLSLAGREPGRRCACTWRPAEPARFVLLDAPCTATGAIRRHPDVPHLKTPDDVARLAAVQERLLAAAVEMLAPGGMLVYCTCSLEPQEGVQQVDAPARARRAGGAAADLPRRDRRACRMHHRRRRSAHAALPSRRA